MTKITDERPITHTPTPWQWKRTSSKEIEISSDQSCFWIAKVLLTHDGFVEGVLNAEYIVEACNNYDALRASHKQLVLQAEALQGYYETDFFKITSVDGRTLADWYVKFCKAIDAAKQLSQ